MPKSKVKKIVFGAPPPIFIIEKFTPLDKIFVDPPLDRKPKKEKKK